MTTREQRLAFLLWLPPLFLLLGRLAVVWLYQGRDLVTLTPDDFYYYLQIAQNIAAGGGSSFDSLHLTNGYHPLWMVVCSTVALIQGASLEFADRILYARSILTIQIFIGIVSLFFMAFGAMRAGFSRLSHLAMAAVFSTPWAIYGFTDGLESGLTILALSTLFLFVTIHDPFRTAVNKRDVTFGMLLSMLFLSRLDTAFLCLGIGVVALFLGRVRGWLWLRDKGLAWGTPVLVTLFVYMFLNESNFGHTMPISGSLKSTFPMPSWGLDQLWFNKIPVAAGLLALVLQLCFLRKQPEKLQSFLTASVISIALLLVYTGGFADWAIHKWHFTICWPILAMVIGGLLSRATFSRGLYMGAVSVLLLGVATQVLFLRGRSDFAFQARSYDAALWARENIRPGQAMAMSDSGVFAYLRGGLVVNLDGVVNDWDYQDALVEEGLENYLNEKGIDFIVHHAVKAERVPFGYDNYVYTAKSHRYNKPGGAVTFSMENEKYRSDVYHDGSGKVVFLIWRVDRTLGEDFTRGYIP